MSQFSRVFPARLSAFESLTGLVDQFSVVAGLQRNHALKLRLVLEELFINSIRHGYGGDCDAPIWVTLEQQLDCVRVTYEDAAPAYDPLAAPRHGDLTLPAEQRPIGGLGVLLTVRLSRDIEYRYAQGRNCIRLHLAGGDVDSASAG